jgi:P27 family predicted phage terminase small subunit
LAHFPKKFSLGSGRQIGQESRRQRLPTDDERKCTVPGPRPIPTHLKLLRGNRGHQKLNRDEPQPPRGNEPPEPPPFLSGYASDEWWRVAPGLHALGLLTPLDTMVLGAYCVAAARWRTAEELLAQLATRDPQTHGLLVRSRSTGDARLNPLLKLAAAAASDMVKFASEFGFSPAARSRISAGIAYELAPRKFAGLLAGED